jgi:amino acid permease
MSSSPTLGGSHEEKTFGKTKVDHDYLNDQHHRDEEVGIVNKSAPLQRSLKGRHMQMIAIGKSCRQRAFPIIQTLERFS